MTTEQRIKKAFPDYKDWPDWALPATIEIMDAHTSAAVQAERERIVNLGLTVTCKLDGVTCGRGMTLKDLGV